MGLDARLAKLETVMRPDRPDVDAVALDVPGRGDLFLSRGRWQECPDGRALLATLTGWPVKVTKGFDPSEV